MEMRPLGVCDSYREAQRKRENLDGWRVTRRGVLASIGFGAIGWLGTSRSLAQAVISNDKDYDGDIIVSIFLRGGMDGLSAVVPYQEDAYHRLRPNLRLRSPRDSSRGDAYKVIDLDGKFGLNPALAPLLPFYRAGEMAIVHAVGSGDRTRSHFEAMSAMGRGIDQVQNGQQTGWLARHLASSPRPNPSPLRAISLTSTMPDSLRGASHATAMEDLSAYRLEDPNQAEVLKKLYGSGKDAMSTAGRETLAVMDKLQGIESKPRGGYPNSELGKGLSQLATLIRADVGLEIACLEMGGWDTHVAQGTISGWLPGYLSELSAAISAFVRDMGSEMSRITIVVQTEFGRRVEENTGLGTDHGRASAMFLLGRNVNGDKVYADWPGLEKHQLDTVGDLRVTTDYREVLADLLAKRVPNSEPQSVFQNWQPTKSGYFR